MNTKELQRIVNRLFKDSCEVREAISMRRCREYVAHRNKYDNIYGYCIEGHKVVKKRLVDLSVCGTCYATAKEAYESEKKNLEHFKKYCKRTIEEYTRDLEDTLEDIKQLKQSYKEFKDDNK